MDFQKQGGPAFPTFMKESAAFGQDFCQEGMTLRDWFAGQVLGHIIFAQEAGGSPSKLIDVMQGIRAGGHEARTAYAFADAMIAERSKP